MSWPSHRAAAISSEPVFRNAPLGQLLPAAPAVPSAGCPDIPEEGEALISSASTTMTRYRGNVGRELDADPQIKLDRVVDPAFPIRLFTHLARMAP